MKLGLPPKSHRAAAKQAITHTRGAVVRAGQKARAGKCLAALQDLQYAEQTMGYIDAHLTASGDIKSSDPLVKQFTRLRDGLWSVSQRFRKVCLR
jgi:hypothetical protein